MKTEYKVGAH